MYRLTTMVDGVGVTRYTYNAVSQILSEDGPWSDHAITYGYTATPNPKGIASSSPPLGTRPLGLEKENEQ